MEPPYLFTPIRMKRLTGIWVLRCISFFVLTYVGREPRLLIFSKSIAFYIFLTTEMFNIINPLRRSQIIPNGYWVWFSDFNMTVTVEYCFLKPKREAVWKFCLINNVLWDPQIYICLRCVTNKVLLLEVSIYINVINPVHVDMYCRLMVNYNDNWINELRSYCI